MAIRLSKQQYERMMRRASAVQVTETESPKLARRMRKRQPAEMCMSEQERHAAEAFLRAARANGWQADTIKFPCEHQPAAHWHGKPYNHIVVWRGREQRMWCLCEVMTMDENKMSEAMGMTEREKEDGTTKT